MTEQSLVTQLKGIGFSQGRQVKLYGEKFEMVSDPLVIADNKVVVEAVEEKSGESRRVPIPLPVLKMKNRAA